VSWKNQLEDLSDKWRVVVPDMRGYGGTDKPLPVRAYTLAQLCSDVDGLIGELHVQDVHLLGHDWGGAVAWEFAGRYPHRVRSLTVLNCPAVSVMAKAMLTIPAQTFKSWYIAFFQLPWLPEWLLRRDPEATVMRAFHRGAVNREPFTAELAAPYIEQVRVRGLQGGINYYRANRSALRGKVRRVRVPSQLLWGEGDPFLGPWFLEPKRWRDAVDDLTIHAIEGAGHWVQQEQPRQVNALLRQWLQTHADK
jgi:pimeloyl-ACP methyl ester carboxylesterase